MSRPADQDAEIRDLVEASISKRKMGVEYGFDVTWQPVQMQTPGGVQNVVVYTIVLTRRSPLLGQAPMYHLAQIMSPRPTPEQVDEQVADGIRQLAALHESLKRPPEAPPAGQVVALANGRRS